MPEELFAGELCAVSASKNCENAICIIDCLFSGMKEKINDIAEAMTLAVSLKSGAVSELKELVCLNTLDKLVEWEWIYLEK